MKRIHYYTLIAAFLCAICEACPSGESAKVQFPPMEKLQADSISIPSILLAVNYMFTTGDVLVTYEPKKDTLFSFWKLPQCDYLFSAGRKGKGPNEFLTLDRSFVATPEGFKTFEIASNRIKYISVDVEGDFRVTQAQQLDTDRMGLNRFLFLTDSSYCFVSNKEEYEYTLLNKHSLKDFSAYPEGILEKKKEEMNRFAYNKLTIAHPSGEKFAAFYAYLKLCRIYNSRGELLKETFMDVPKTVSPDERTVYYSSYPCADERFIYVLTGTPQQPILEVWSWDGAPKAHYLLDKNVQCIAVSAHYRTIYGINKENEDVIYTYRLPDFISD